MDRVNGDLFLNIMYFPSLPLNRFHMRRFSVLKPVSSTILPISLSELGSKRYSSADDDEGYSKDTLLTGNEFISSTFHLDATISCQGSYRFCRIKFTRF